MDAGDKVVERIKAKARLDGLESKSPSEGHSGFQRDRG
jgi:hypothetical protein